MQRFASTQKDHISHRWCNS